MTNRQFLFGLLCGASAAVSSSFLMGRQAFFQQGMSAIATSLITSGNASPRSATTEKSQKESSNKQDDETAPSLTSYYHLMVDAAGGTSIRKRDFQNTKQVGYSNTPQIVKELNPDFATPNKVVFTALEGENPWHYCPAPQIVVCLRGGWYIRTNDGQVTEFRPGDVLYQDNTEEHPGATKTKKHGGQHFSGSLDGQPCDQMIVQLDLVDGPKVTTPQDPPPL